MWCSDLKVAGSKPLTADQPPFDAPLLGATPFLKTMHTVVSSLNGVKNSEKKTREELATCDDIIQHAEAMDLMNRVVTP